MLTLPLLLLLAQTPHDGPLTRAVHGAIAAHIVAQAVDLSSTERALGMGRFKEANPLMRWASDPLPMGLVKGGYTVASSYLLIRLSRHHPKVALTAALASTMLTSWVAYSNLRQIANH